MCLVGLMIIIFSVFSDKLLMQGLEVLDLLYK